MYFSRLTMRPDASKSPEFLRIASGPYQIHQMVWDLFLHPEHTERDFLYRVDRRMGSPVVYVLSSREPVYLGRLWRVETKPFNPVLHRGQRLVFSLRANPVVSRRMDPDDDGKRRLVRHDVVMDAKKKLQKEYGKVRFRMADLVQQEGTRWLRSRAERHGFSIGDGAVRADGYRQIRFRKGKSGNTVSISTIDFTGILTVTDPDLFLESLRSGIGPAKGFGCGLMMIRRA
ncbi:MAG: type I-E CRISPR-associated protein Cas6/Cse3/CasE [Methanoculleaceae archaeon]